MTDSPAAQGDVVERAKALLVERSMVMLLNEGKGVIELLVAEVEKLRAESVADNAYWQAEIEQLKTRLRGQTGYDDPRLTDRIATLEAALREAREGVTTFLNWNVEDQGDPTYYLEGAVARIDAALSIDTTEGGRRG